MMSLGGIFVLSRFETFSCDAPFGAQPGTL